MRLNQTYLIRTLGHDDPTMIKYLMDYVHEHPDEFDFHRAQDIPLDDLMCINYYRYEIIGIKGEDDLRSIASFGIQSLVHHLLAKC